MCVPTEVFDNTNITCMGCSKFHCTQCTDQMWTGVWNGEVFYKPKLVVPGLQHEVFRCAFCRASFDRIREVDGDGYKWVQGEDGSRALVRTDDA